MHSFQMFFARPLTSLFLLQKEQTINKKKENLSRISGMLPPKNVKFNSMKWLEIKFEFLLFLYD